jgi:ATP-dependent helicase/nuclease subunit A
MPVIFTPDQQRVIDTRNSNILVSAAAGSGKTAVLVERIIKMITDEQNPVDIDRLLIVTFTSAAAAQMRERISKAVAKKLEENPENEHLQRQSSLIHNAQITTIDSFCLFVIRNNFNEIGIDPGFRVADESEVKMLEADVMDKLLEDEHTTGTEKFLNFIESYSTGASENKIDEAILRLYHFSMSYPFPEDWLKERLNDYKLDNINELPQKQWFKGALDYVKTIIGECITRLHQALDIAGSVGGPLQYSENLADDLALMEKFMNTSDYNELYDLFTYSSFSRLSNKKGENVEPVLKDMVKSIRDEVKKNVADLKKFLFQISIDATINDMSLCQENVEELVRLTLSFKERLDNAKREKNIIDFSDMEHFALKILLEKDDNGNIIPRNTALELQDYFHEIMIDEYQDSNEVQELLLKCISGENKGNYNRFMVGDVKQSIYKFRLARPEIFMEKYNTYPIDQDDSPNVRIDLSKNFRSRREVTDATNFICSQLMSKKVGNVEYDKNSALYVGASYPEPLEKDLYKTELLIATQNNNSESKNEKNKSKEKEIEALMVAERINSLVGNFPVTDSDTGEVRPAKFSDIVLLFRTTAGWDEDFRRILMEQGIPVHVTSKTGYFETLEIQGIVNLLRVLDNPLQDIPLFGVMKLPYFGFNDVELAYIKCSVRDYLNNNDMAEKKLFLYEQVKLFKEIGNFNQVSKEKIDRLIDTITLYRKKVSYTPIKELINELIDKTGYEAYVGSMPGGDQRIANIELLLEKAGAFENTSFYGLFHFIRYLETIQEQEVDFGEANILDENADVVRIMTIHKSKGLEFPICFVCGLSKNFNLMDMRESIIMDVELGIGVDYIDTELRVKRKTMRKNVVAQRMKEDTRGEDLRVLYVALTRAKEKLILTGFCSDIDKMLTSNIVLTMEKEEKLPYSVIMDSTSYMDMIIASLMRHNSMKEILEEKGFDFEKHELPYMDVPIGITIYNENDELAGKLSSEIRRQGRGDTLLKQLENAETKADKEMRQDLENKLNYIYPHKDLEGLTVKTTVSELKKASYEEAYNEATPLNEIAQISKETYIPKFAREEDTTEAKLGTVYGTAVHRFMELLSFDEKLICDDDKKLYAIICTERDNWIKNGVVGKDELTCVSVAKIIDFMKSDLAHRMVKAQAKGKLYKEQPFVLGVEADKLKATYPSTETILIQGVIDTFFYENDEEIILSDYKTDRVENADELIKRYKTQLDYYQLALERITGKKVKARYIYAFALGQEIIC